jgi:Ribonuclease G/E
MSKEILISVEPQEKRVAIVTDGQLDEYEIERPKDKTIDGITLAPLHSSASRLA